MISIGMPTPTPQWMVDLFPRLCEPCRAKVRAALDGGAKVGANGLCVTCAHVVSEAMVAEAFKRVAGELGGNN